MNKSENNLDAGGPDATIMTMFRVSSANHQKLSDMADNKAQLLITVNSIILSATISLVFRKTGNHPDLLLPGWSLLLVSLATMIFSILSTRPAAITGSTRKEDIDDKKANLLFFGNFCRMNLHEYAYGMSRMMDDHDFLYDSFILDLYMQGRVLGKKYRLLRIAYNTFMFGMIFSVMAFIAGI